MINFIFKRIPISYKKFSLYSKVLSNKPIFYFYHVNFTNKVNLYLKKIANYIILIIKNVNIFVRNFLVGKSICIKKVNYRGKGRINFTKKKYTNINLKILYGKKN